MNIGGFGFASARVGAKGHRLPIGRHLTVDGKSKHEVARTQVVAVIDNLYASKVHANSATQGVEFTSDFEPQSCLLVVGCDHEEKILIRLQVWNLRRVRNAYTRELRKHLRTLIEGRSIVCAYCREFERRCLAHLQNRQRRSLGGKTYCSGVTSWNRFHVVNESEF